jgi:hypothetical protein
LNFPKECNEDGLEGEGSVEPEDDWSVGNEVIREDVKSIQLSSSKGREGVDDGADMIT